MLSFKIENDLYPVAVRFQIQVSGNKLRIFIVDDDDVGEPWSSDMDESSSSSKALVL